MTKIEKSLIESVGNSLEGGKAWKLLTSNGVVNPSMELSEREETIKTALYDIMNSNGRFCGGMQFSLKKLNGLFINFDDGKLLARISVLPTPKEVEKVCKSIYLDVLNNPDCVAYPVVSVNPEGVVMLYGVCKSVSVYSLKKETEKAKGKATEGKETEETTEGATLPEVEGDNLLKIHNLLNEVVNLAEGLDEATRHNIVSTLAEGLKISLAPSVEVVKKGKKSA